MPQRKQRPLGEVLLDLEAILKKSPSDAARSNHILLEILVATLEIRDLLAHPIRSTKKCDFNAKTPGH